MYGGSLQGLQLDVPIIYRGTFGTGMFQCLYQPGVAHWAMLPSTLEWQVAALLLGLAGALVGPSGWVLGAGMLGLSLLVAALQAAQARLVPTHRRVVCPTPHRRALLCPAARPVLDAVSDPAVIATCPRARSGAIGWPSAAVAVDGLSVGGLLVGGGD